MRVALDTSALMLPVQSGVRVFDELDRLLGAGAYDLVVPRAVVDELEALARGGGEDATAPRGEAAAAGTASSEEATAVGTASSEEATAASVGRDLADRCEVVETDASYADDALVELAEQGDVDYVVTNDRPLRDRLPCKVIGLRGRNQLALN